MSAMQVTIGNAATDGALFNGWFIGQLEKWASEKAGAEGGSFALRDSAIVEMKWGVHSAGEARADWAPCSEHTTLSLLVRGKFLLRLRSPHDRTAIAEQRLAREGDYAIWGTDVEHTWLVEEDAVIFTVRWREKA
jgi:hypothetical protein